MPESVFSCCVCVHVFWGLGKCNRSTGLKLMNSARATLVSGNRNTTSFIYLVYLLLVNFTWTKDAIETNFSTYFHATCYSPSWWHQTLFSLRVPRTQSIKLIDGWFDFFLCLWGIRDLLLFVWYITPPLPEGSWLLRPAQGPWWQPEGRSPKLVCPRAAIKQLKTELIWNRTP
jgi:hypothetical protein